MEDYEFYEMEYEKEQELIPERTYSVAVLCSGIGGSVIGYEKQSFHVHVVVDQNEASAQIIQRNFPETVVLSQPIEEIKGQDILMLFEGTPDVLDITIPTRYVRHQPNFSVTEQSKFLMEVARILYEVQPKTFVCHMEAYFTRGKHRLIVNEWLELLKRVGYNVQLETLKNVLYGIPNDNEWGFLVGIRKDIGIKPVFPEALEWSVSTEESIGDLLHEEGDVAINPVRLDYVKRYFPAGCTTREAKKIIEEQELGISPSHYRRDRWEAPYYALHSSTIRPFHPKIDRLLTVREIKRLQTFPDWYVLSENPTFNWKEVASSIPPFLIQQFAHAIQKEILRHL